MNTTEIHDDGERLITSRELLTLLPISPMTLWRWTNDPTIAFPKGKKLAGGRCFWNLAEVRRWIDGRGAAA